jgi:pyruvate/2-oxoglutarate dehydrogenase complex dihydrolipoamide dehydrogenase (E3) component
VNDRLETNVKGVYALGDVKGGPAFTHVSYDDYRVVEANLLNGGSASIENRIVPYCVFTDPELGRVGLTEREARERGLRFEVARLPMKRVARALETDETGLQSHHRSDTMQILGATIWASDEMSVIEVAMMGKLPYTVLRDGIFAHPTLAESLNNLFWDLGD